MAQYLGVAPESIAFLASASRAINAAFEAVATTDAGELVIVDTEFPASVLAGHRFRERGGGLRVLKTTAGAVDVSQILDAVDGGTAAVLLSAVSFITGASVDLPCLHAELRRRGVPLIVDATQAVGACPIDVRNSDICVFGTYKWLLGPHGLGVLYLNPETTEDYRPRYSGWRGITDLFADDRLIRHTLHPTAARFEEGMPNYLALSVLTQALEFLSQWGVDLRLRSQHVARALWTDLRDDGWNVWPTTDSRLSTIVTIQTEQALEYAAALAEDGVVVWARQSTLRASPHFYNDGRDLEMLVAALRRARG